MIKINGGRKIVPVSVVDVDWLTALAFTMIDAAYLHDDLLPVRSDQA